MPKDDHYWTSGTSEGPLSADHPIWCATKQFMDTKQFEDPNIQLNYPLLKRYMALDFDQTRFGPNHGIFHQSDYYSYYAICENNHLS